MWLQFIGQNIHFALNLGAALVFLAISWLYLDAWTNHRALKEGCKWVGFGLLSLSFLAQATLIEQTVLGVSIFENAISYIIMVFRVVGYVVLLIGIRLDPIQERPNTTGLDAKDFAKKKGFLRRFRTTAPVPNNASLGPMGVVLEPLPSKEEVEAKKEQKNSLVNAAEDGEDGLKKNYVVLGFAGVLGKLVMPIGGLIVARLYWMHATKGLERHLKRLALGFFCIAVADFIGIASVLRDTTNPILYSWVSAFGWLWVLEQAALAAGVALLGVWVWSYLTKRFLSQLFIIFVGLIVLVFLVVSVALTALLLRNVRNDALTNLTTAAKVLHYGIAAKQSETSAGAAQLAANKEIAQAVAAKDHNALAVLAGSYLKEKRQTSLVIVHGSGQVLFRGEDTEKWGDSVSSDTLVQRALQGSGQSSVRAYDGVNAPTLVARSAVAVRDGQGAIVGAVVTGLELGVPFVDGIKQATGLESSLYVKEVLAATTVFSSDGKTRSTGTKLSSSKVVRQVVERGEIYKGDFSVQNRRFLGVFLPLKDVDNVSIGMIMVSQPQSLALTTAGRSIEATFLIAAALLLLSVVPAFFIARGLESQIR